MGLKFKTDQLAEEWKETYPPLRAQVLELAYFAEELAAPDLVVTCLYRTPDENMTVGGKPTSLHMVKPIRAVDIRRRTLNEMQVEQLHQHWNRYKPSMLFGFNDEPEKAHIHLQVRES
jgi:uncharacterized protein YcbK (DUF882 family)